MENIFKRMIRNDIDIKIFGLNQLTYDEFMRAKPMFSYLLDKHSGKLVGPDGSMGSAPVLDDFCLAFNIGDRRSQPFYLDLKSLRCVEVFSTQDNDYASVILSVIRVINLVNPKVTAEADDAHRWSGSDNARAAKDHLLVTNYNTYQTLLNEGQSYGEGRGLSPEHCAALFAAALVKQGLCVQVQDSHFGTSDFRVFVSEKIIRVEGLETVTFNVEDGVIKPLERDVLRVLGLAPEGGENV